MKLLSEERLQASLSDEVRKYLSFVRMVDSVGSTNAVLLGGVNGALGKNTEAHQAPGQARGEAKGNGVLIARQQTAGRGRQGRVWQSPPGAGLWMSLRWQFDQAMTPVLGQLSVATAICVIEQLRELCGHDKVEAKWPNDLVAEQAKLGGLLLESTTQTDGQHALVIGLGLNVALPQATRAAIDQPVTDLSQLAGAAANGLLEQPEPWVARIIQALCQLCIHFPEQGFAPWYQAWQNVDSCMGRPVHVQTPQASMHGTCQGIDEQARLIICDDHGYKQVFTSAEVSLRSM